MERVLEGPPRRVRWGQGLLQAYRGVRRRELTRQAFVLAMLGWVPLVVAAGLDAFVQRHLGPLLLDFAVHARLLIAVPCAYAAAEMLASRRREVLLRLAEEGIVRDRQALSRVEEEAERTERSRAVALFLVVLAFAAGQGAFWSGRAPGSLVLGREAAAHAERGVAGIWYGWVAFPVFALLVLRFLVLWLAWTRAMWRVSRLELRTSATHPDGAAGLGFVSRPTVALALYVFGTSSVAAAQWGTLIAFQGAHATQFVPAFSVWVCVVLLLEVAPLLPFVGHLVRARRDGIRQYGRFALDYTWRFHERWIAREPGPDLLGSADIQALNDLIGAVRTIDDVEVFPVKLRAIAGLLAAAILPMIPLVLTEIPLSKLLAHLVGSVIGIGGE